jgi:biopolymer transport protein ExbD
MARKINKRGAVAPEMNITPLIDVVFLLIIFFLIVSKIVSDERTPMIVPQLVDPQSQELEAEYRVLVNVARAEADVDRRRGELGGVTEHKHLSGPGNADFMKLGATGPRWAINGQNLTKLTNQLKAKKEQYENVEVLLRADSALHYSEVAPVTNAITNAGIGQVNMVAFKDEKPF